VKNYVIDANALISFVTDRNPEQQAKISKILQTAAQLKSRILCPQNVLTEFIYVLDKVYGVSRNQIKKMIFDFTVMPGVSVIHDLDLNIVLSYWPESIPDFDDAVVAAVYRSTQATAIVTFDQKRQNKWRLLGMDVVG